jgi:hypothetical protein
MSCLLSPLVTVYCQLVFSSSPTTPARHSVESSRVSVDKSKLGAKQEKMAQVVKEERT